MSELSKELPSGRLPSNLTNMEDMTGIAAALLRRGIKADKIIDRFGLSLECVVVASKHILSSDEGVAATLEAICLRLATGYWTTEMVGFGRRSPPQEKKIWHPPSEKAIELLFDAIDRKRLGAAERRKPAPPPKARKVKGYGLPSITLDTDGNLPEATPDNKNEQPDG